MCSVTGGAAAERDVAQVAAGEQRRIDQRRQRDRREADCRRRRRPWFEAPSQTSSPPAAAPTPDRSIRRCGRRRDTAPADSIRGSTATRSRCAAFPVPGPRRPVRARWSISRSMPSRSLRPGPRGETRPGRRSRGARPGSRPPAVKSGPPSEVSGPAGLVPARQPLGIHEGQRPGSTGSVEVGRHDAARRGARIDSDRRGRCRLRGHLRARSPDPARSRNCEGDSPETRPTGARSHRKRALDAGRFLFRHELLEHRLAHEIGG